MIETNSKNLLYFQFRLYTHACNWKTTRKSSKFEQLTENSKRTNKASFKGLHYNPATNTKFRTKKPLHNVNKFA